MEKFIKNLIVIISLFYLPNLSFSQVAIDSTEIEKILKVFIKDIDEKFSDIKPYELSVLDKSEYKLNSYFIPRIKAAMKKYSEMKVSSDSLINLKYQLNKSRKKFKNIFRDDEIIYFHCYENFDDIFNYKDFINQKDIILLDSLLFFDKKSLNNANLYSLKIILKGPFLSEDKTKALLEVYKYHEKSTLFLIYRRDEVDWKLVGNVNF